ncbi:MAG: hypothetical protein QNJ51_07830 [Calothrix sp. MO_167.B12]|nr:hypothetical protein [Calothrix sp. MO_167.B12]
MSDIAILKEMIKESARVPLENYGNNKKVKNRVILTEQDHNTNYSVTIYGMPKEDQVIVIKADKFKPPDTVFTGLKGECKRADFVIIADVGTKQVILCIEMKAKKTTSKNKIIIPQLKGAKCFAAYCQKIGKEFWGQPNFLDSYVYRFVSIKNISISKRQTHEPITDDHKTPEQMLTISSPNYLQFNRLIGERK